ncbi:MAG TPA: hypothetical protein EYP46_04425, partial [Hadesarchaea archaeon]|nr:hypothetical protein [Hadesarchaea archaeon]
MAAGDYEIIVQATGADGVTVNSSLNLRITLEVETVEERREKFEYEENEELEFVLKRFEWYEETLNFDRLSSEELERRWEREEAQAENLRTIDLAALDPGPLPSRMTTPTAEYEGRYLPVSQIRQPENIDTSGNLGLWLEVKGENISGAVLRVPLSSLSVVDENLETLRAFRYDSRQGLFILPYSGIGRTKDYAWARIPGKGTYTFYALPRDDPFFQPSDVPVSILDPLLPLNQIRLTALAPNGSWLAWEPIGPTNFAGRTKALEITQDGTLYAGAAEGGVWRSTDGGVTWKSLMENVPSLAVGDIATVTDENGTFVIYVGTGEYTGEGGAVSAYAGKGLLYSVDGGETWKLIQWADYPKRISTVLVHPEQPNLVWVAGRNGLYILNASKSYQVEHSFLQNFNFSDGVLHPTDPSTAYFGTVDHGFFEINLTIEGDTVTGSLLKQMNQGLDNWKGMATIALYKDDPSIMYAKIDTRVYKWNNGSWSLLKKFKETLHGWCNDIEVSPDDPDVVFAMEVKLYWSFDGGSTWHELEGGHADYHDIVFSPEITHTSLVLEPEEGGFGYREVYVANDAGVFSRELPTYGAMWAPEKDEDLPLKVVHPGWKGEFTPRNGSPAAPLVTSQFYGVSVSQTPNFAVGGSTQDIGVRITPPEYYTHENDVYMYPFNKLAGNEGGPFEISPTDEKVVAWNPWSARQGVVYST